jgi:hypothetical protein
VDSAHNLLYEVEALAPHQCIARQIQMTDQRLTNQPKVEQSYHIVYIHEYGQSTIINI